MRPGRRGWNRPQPLRTNRKNRHTASAAVPLALALIVGGIAIGYGHKQLARTNRSDLIATTTGAVILPFQKGTAATQSGITGSFEALFRGGALQKENRKLSVRNSVLEAEVARLRDADAEAKRLRAEVDYIAAQKRPPAVCEVVGWLPSPIRQTITVANSPSSGIRKDAAVVDSVGRMIGHVVETEGLRAHVLLLIDPDSHIHAQVLRAGKIVGSGVVSGDGRDRLLKLEFLKPDDPVKKGDWIVTSGEGGKFPQGKLLGFVEKVSQDAAHFAKVVQVKPATPQPGALREVLVLR